MINCHFKGNHSELKTLASLATIALLRLRRICVGTTVTQESVRTELMIGTVLLAGLPPWWGVEKYWVTDTSCEWKPEQNEVELVCEQRETCARSSVRFHTFCWGCAGRVVCVSPVLWANRDSAAVAVVVLVSEDTCYKPTCLWLSTDQHGGFRPEWLQTSVEAWPWERQCWLLVGWFTRCRFPLMFWGHFLIVSPCNNSAYAGPYVTAAESASVYTFTLFTLLAFVLTNKSYFVLFWRKETCLNVHVAQGF